VTAYLFHG